MNDKTLKRKRILSIAILLLLIGLGAWIYLTAGREMLSLVADADALRAWVDSHGWRSRIIYGAFVALQVIVAPIPGGALEIAAGYAFGTLEGTLICLAGIFVASVLIFAAVRRFGMRVVRLFFSEEKIESMRFLHSSPRMLLLMTILMVVPGTPKDLLTYFAGLTDLKWGPWLLMCSLGRVPSVVTSVWGGSAFGDGNYGKTIAIAALIVILTGIGALLYRRMGKK